MGISLPLTALSTGGNLVSGIFGSNASKTAASQQVQSAQQGLDFQKQVWGQQQNNQAPFLQAGQQSISQLMDALKNGTFGPGSIPLAPQFQAPTLADAQQTPGYQFAAQQGSKGILEGAAAAGGAISGGTLKSLDQFNTNLANSTYGDVFNRALSTYQTGMQGYQANLQRQSQEFNQLLAPAQIGEGATQNLNTSGTQAALNVGNLMTQIGNAQAAGTVGSANAWANAIGGVTNSLSEGYALNSKDPRLQNAAYEALLKSLSPKPAGTGPG